jgi:hypothetical protein
MTTDRALLVRTARQVLAEHQGVAHLQRFLEAKLTREQVAHLKHLGVLTRPRIGWYADPTLPTAGIRAVRVGGVLGCTSAAAAWGMVVPERADRRLEVSIAPGTTRLRRADDATRRAWARSEPDVRWHWEQRADPVAGWRVSALDAILQLAACVEWRWLVAAIDSARCAAQHPPLLSDPEVARLRELLPEHLRSAVDRSDPRSETSGETMVRLAAEDAGIPFVPNVRVTSKYRPDGLVDGWLPIEIDGIASHSGTEAVEQDHTRDATIAQFGTHPLRFTQNHAVRETDWVIETIRRVWLRGSAETGRHAGEEELPPGVSA